MADLQELDKTFSIHEQVCAERWKEAILRIKRLEMVLVGSAGAIIMLLMGIVLKVH
tara:strand:+ start:57 stop:224 length:168 start_codon:yes stop_codon:yes gene_type:complete